MSLTSSFTTDGDSDDDFASLLESELDSNPQPSQDQNHRIKRRRLFEGTEEILESANVQEEEQLSSISEKCPPHPGYMWGVCILCGQIKKDMENEEKPGVSFKYIHKDLELADSEITRFREDELASLVSRQQKLYLVLDLDHTLLNSARFADVLPEEESYITSRYLVGENNDGSASDKSKSTNGDLLKLEGLKIWTKLRPFVHRFLEEASEMYEMCIYTMGERFYALKMAKLLDPSGKYFGTRIISATDSTHHHQKNLDVVLGAESAVVILDDTENVWPKHRSNLIVVERYHFFRSSCKQFNIQKQSLTQAMTDELETQGTLSVLLRVLCSVHQMFNDKRNVEDISEFGLNSRDVREILKEIRSKVLEGCKLVFSGVFPTQCHVETHHLWLLAEELGAKCATTVEEDVTHVISLDSGTNESCWAIQNNRSLVHPHWLEASKYLWQRQPEEKFIASTIQSPESSGFPESVSMLPSQ